MKNKKPIWIILIILVLSLLLILIFNKEQTFKIINFSNENGVRNTTQNQYLDTIVQVGLDALELKGVSVLVRDMDKDRKIGDYEVEAYIIGSDKQYIIFVNPMSRDKALEVLSHELIHLFQSERRKLQKRSNYIIWEGDTILNPNEIEYGDRPWEKEAFLFGRHLEKEIREQLVK